MISLHPKIITKWKKYKTTWFTSDEHYLHSAVITYSKRPFTDVANMTDSLIKNHNAIVDDDDLTVHVGDFTLTRNLSYIYDILDRLNGYHLFVRGSHDYWLDSLSNKRLCQSHEIIECAISDKLKIVACHYPMVTWPRSHYGSWHVYGHHHGRFQNGGKSFDVGVDANDYKPVSMDQIKLKMESLPQNINFISVENRKKRPDYKS